MSDDYGFIDPVIPDIGVEVYALRTFTVQDGQLKSIVQSGSHWHDGICEAVCLKHKDDPEHVAPMPSPCRCGIYGCLTLAALHRQYPGETSRIVAVIAAEGKTMMGTVGLRTAVARVEAYWVAEDRETWAVTFNRPDGRSVGPRPVNEAAVCAQQMGGARRFRDVYVMCRLYGLS